jgi:hypothetical protein
MVYTCAEDRADLDHILSNVFFRVRADSILLRALDHHGIMVADNIYWMDSDMIRILSYLDDEGGEILLP